MIAPLLSLVLVPLSTATAFVDVTVLPMNRNEQLEGQTVLVEDGVIRSIGPNDKIAVPRGARRIDGRGKFLLPGLVDMHAHLYSEPELTLYLTNGITTVYNLNGSPADLKWRERVRKGDLDGPDIVTCAPTIFRCDTADEARTKVSEYAKQGYDAIKIYNGVKKEAFPALIAEARRHGMLTVGHIPREVGLEGVLEAKMTIAHAEEYLYTFLREADEAKVQRAAEMTVKAKVPVIPTLSTFSHILEQGRDLKSLLARPEFQYLSPWSAAGWQPGKNRYESRFATPESHRMLANMLEAQKGLIRRIYKLGGTILTGTDAMCPGMVPGFGLVEEVEFLVSAGLTPFDALKAATKAPAEVLGRSETQGTVEVGRRADLLLVSADPLANPANLRLVDGVMARGKWFAKAELSRRLTALPKAYGRIFDQATRLIESKPERAAAFLVENDPFSELRRAVLLDRLEKKGEDAFGALLAKLRTSPAMAEAASEEAVNELGYYLLADKSRQRLALALFHRNTVDFPRSANTWDSLAEAYLTAGDREKAIEYYRKALTVDPNLESAQTALKKLTGG